MSSSKLHPITSHREQASGVQPVFVAVGDTELVIKPIAVRSAVVTGDYGSG
jgi:hypothetical protein